MPIMWRARASKPSTSQWPSHLDRDRTRRFGFGRNKARDGLRQDASALFDAQRMPRRLRGLRVSQRLRDLRFAGVGAPHDFAPVDGTDGDEFLRHGGPMHACCG
jgi:hypothetical protein